MNLHNFTAVDFETATSDKMICQVGIVTVRNGEICEKLSLFVQPPLNRYDNGTINVHHITPNRTQNEPTFDLIWPEIEHYFVNQVVYAHNKWFDEPALHQSLNHYGIMPMGVQPFQCTCEAFRGKKLEFLCKGFGIPYDSNKHHDALYDAECCALFAIKHLNGEEPNWDIIDALTIQANEKKKMKESQSSRKRKEHLRGDIFQKDLSCADENSPFYDRKVVITGEFNQTRKEIAQKLKSMGADIDSNITKRTNFVLIGDEPGPVKIEKLEKLIHDGFNIKKLYQRDLDSIFNGNLRLYYGEKEIKKSLDFTIKHYLDHHVTFDNGYNIIASKDLFFPKNLSGNIDLFHQLAGNLGASGDNEIYPETNICILSDSTLEKLRNGEKDSTIQYIQDFYNNNKSITFDFTFLAESEILNYCKDRCENCGDELTLDMYERYIESGIKKIEKTKACKYEFKPGKNYCKVDGKIVLKLSDGRTWCPSRQFRGDVYNITESKEKNE